MENLNKNGVVDLLVKNEVGYFEKGVFEVRSFWKHCCEETENKEKSQHFCQKENREIEITLYPFETLYNRYWMIGGCRHCKKIFYYPIPVDLKF